MKIEKKLTKIDLNPFFHPENKTNLRQKIGSIFQLRFKTDLNQFKIDPNQS